jgi:spore coat protein U-like protein
MTTGVPLQAWRTYTPGQGANADAGSSDTAPLRRMADGSGNLLSYNLYQESGRTTVWGNSEPTGVEYAGTGVSTPVTVFG